MSGKMYNQFKKDPNITTSGFDVNTDVITYEDMLKDEKLTEEDRKRIEKLKHDRDRKLVMDKLDKLKIKY